jgi:hypothetical protein
MGLIEFDEVMDELSFSGMEETSEVENDVSEESDDDFEDDDMMDAEFCSTDVDDYNFAKDPAYHDEPIDEPVMEDEFELDII